MSDTVRYEVIVVGAGPAGLSCALGLAVEGVETVLLAGPHQPAGPGGDHRTAALFGCSIDLLKNLGAFDGLDAASAPIRGIRIIDDTDSVFRAPEVFFSAQELGRDAFGYNIPQSELVAVLRRVAASAGGPLTIVETKGVVEVDVEGDLAHVITAEGARFEASVIVAADGRGSVCRQAAGIEMSSRQLRQSALVTTFAHSRSHVDVSTEFHRRSGPFTVVPMCGRRSSLVWVERPQVADRLVKASETKFRKILESRLQGLLGDVNDFSPRSVFPLGSSVARVMARQRIALIGESGHAIPPIGAQGLNLGLHDGAAFVDLARARKDAGEDLGSDDVMRAYNRTRWLDVHGRAGAVDALNGSLISGIGALQFARGAGLHALNAVGPLRRFVLKRGLQPLHALPRLMRTDRADVDA